MPVRKMQFPRAQGETASTGEPRPGKRAFSICDARSLIVSQDVRGHGGDRYSRDEHGGTWRLG